MSGPEPVVALRAATGPRPDDRALAGAWAASGRSVLTPDLAPGPGAVVLEDPGLRVLAAISAAGADRAVLQGSGYGAMVALHLAANYPTRASALVLTTAARLVDRTRRSVSDAVTVLLPVARVQRLGTRQERVLELLDQVRTTDYAGFVARVQVRALVVVGERDLGNVAPARRLATLLPHAELAVVPGATEGWLAREPERLVEAAAEFLDRT